jgi:hypothetical protein
MGKMAGGVRQCGDTKQLFAAILFSDKDGLKYTQEEGADGGGLRGRRVGMCISGHGR